MHHHRSRAAYYRSEAARVTALAEATPSRDGRGGFAAAALQYRDLADAFDDVDTTEEPLTLGAPVVREMMAPAGGS
jgi:hypothetical protein